MTRSLRSSLRPLALVLFILIGILHLGSCRPGKVIPRRRPSAPAPPTSGSSLENLEHQLDLGSSSLSIVSPIEVLRQRLAAELAGNRIRSAQNRQIASNSEYLRKIGK